MMELLYSVSITFFVLVTISILFSILKSATKSHKKLPPGPMKLPIIGNLHNLIGPLPHQTLQRLSKKYGSLMHLKIGESSTLIVSSAEMVREFTKTNDLSFAQRPKMIAIEVSYGTLYGSIPFTPYGEYWRQMRKLCVIELLSNKLVQSFSFIREEEGRSLLRSFQSSENGSINFSKPLLGLMSMIICRAAFGRRYDREDAALLGAKFKETITLLGSVGLADLYPSVKIFQVVSPTLGKIKKLFKYIDGALQNIVDKHASEARNDVSEMEDLVDILLRVQSAGDLDVPLTTNSIKAIIADMFAAGTDSTATTVEWAMAEMMKHPNVMTKAQEEIRQALKGEKIIKETDIQGLSYLKMVVKETLRLHPPASLLQRECRQPCVIEGYEIPIKTHVLINVWAIGRDPKYWQDAELFYPERFMNSSVDLKGTNYHFIPFGAGRRMCPGINFALANVEIILAQLLYHFDWNLPNQMKPENLDMTERSGTTYRKFDLQLIAVPFIPISE